MTGARGDRSPAQREGRSLENSVGTGRARHRIWRLMPGASIPDRLGISLASWVFLIYALPAVPGQSSAKKGMCTLLPPVRQIEMEIEDREDQVKGTGKKLTKKNGTVTSPAVPDSAPSSIPPVLLGDLRSLIESARVRVAVGVNAELVMLHWHIGHRLCEDIQNYGTECLRRKNCRTGRPRSHECVWPGIF